MANLNPPDLLATGVNGELLRSELHELRFGRLPPEFELLRAIGCLDFNGLWTQRERGLRDFSADWWELRSFNADFDSLGPFLDCELYCRPVEGSRPIYGGSVECSGMTLGVRIRFDYLYVRSVDLLYIPAPILPTFESICMSTPSHPALARLIELSRALRPTTPSACLGCANFDGSSYGGNLLICAIYPYGCSGDVCPDFELGSASA